jgi:chromosome segregation ATPase
MGKLLESQERKLQSELQSLSADYDQQIAKLRQTYENQHQIDLDRLEKEKNDFMQQLIQEQTMHENFKKEQESLVNGLKAQIATMEDQQTTSHARKVENDLAVATAALEEFKRQSQQATENLERRYRDEIRQLQSGSDDTAQAWLEKTRSAQQQVDQLHDELSQKEAAHKQAVENLIQEHTLEIDRLTETCETKETEIEAQSNQIEDLLYQVETLQNSLEAATVRLEHTAKSTPTTSSNRDDINNSVNGAAQHEPIKNIHQECLNRVDAKQKELEDLKSRMKEIKETHETQLNRLGQEKANAIADLRKTITGLEQRLAATPPTTPTRSSSNKNMIDEERLVTIAEQHRKEINTMHEQYQIVVDTKDSELEDYAYRVKALVAGKQKEVEKLQNETNSTIDKYERDIEGYEVSFMSL